MTRPTVFRRLRPLLVDAVAPAAAYYGLRALGVADLQALLVGAAIVAADALISLAIERRLRPLPICVCAMFALTGALAILIHDPRVLLLKPTIASAAIGFYLLAIAFSRQTLGNALTLVIARGSDDRSARWRRAWTTQPAVRRSLRRACGLAGVLLLAEAAARTTIVFGFSIGKSLILAHGPGLVVIVALVLIARFMVQPAVAIALASAPAK